MENNNNSTYCEKCGCRITRGQCEHGMKSPEEKTKKKVINLEYRRAFIALFGGNPLFK